MLPLMRLSKTSVGFALLFTLGLPQTFSSVGSAIAQSFNSSPNTTLQLIQTNQVIFVSPNGLDTNSGTSANQPLRSITAAVKKNLGVGTVIQLADGKYTAETGEQFPIKFPTGVILRGNPTNQGKDIIISGGGRFISPTFARQDIAILAADNFRIEGVTITNANTRGYGLWVESAKNVTITNNTFVKSNHDGVFLTGSATADVSSNIFIQNGANGLSALGTSSGKIQNNTFYNTGFGLAIGQKSQVAVLANRIINNRGGIVVSNLSTPTFRNNLIANNQENGLVVLKDRKGQPIVDLGTNTSLGQNIFQNNKQFDINNASGVKLIAIGNQADPKRTQGAIELVVPKTPLTSPVTPEPVIPVEIPKILPQTTTNSTLSPSTKPSQPPIIKPTTPQTIKPLPPTAPVVKPATPQTTKPVPSSPTSTPPTSA
ncbi:MAG: right-handed parallel beta-helix repeat-containing protein, partial [Pseudanabaena sp.]